MPAEGWESLDEGQSTAVPYRPHGGYGVRPVDRMSDARARRKKRGKSPRSQPFIDPEDFVVREARERFKAMFEAVLAVGHRGGKTGKLALTAFPAGSPHGVGTSPSASTHPTGLGRFLNVVDGPEIKAQRPKKTPKKPSVARMVRSVKGRS